MRIFRRLWALKKLTLKITKMGENFKTRGKYSNIFSARPRSFMLGGIICLNDNESERKMRESKGALSLHLREGKQSRVVPDLTIYVKIPQNLLRGIKKLNLAVENGRWSPSPSLPLSFSLSPSSSLSFSLSVFIDGAKGEILFLVFFPSAREREKTGALTHTRLKLST